MKLFEYEAKSIALKFGIAVPLGYVASTPEEVKEAFLKIGKTAVLKAQVLVAGRGKAGGIMFASSSDEAYKAAETMLGSRVKDEKVFRLLVEEKIQAKKELYVALLVNRSECCYTVLASTEGGVDIEEVAEKTPGKIVRRSLDPLFGLRENESLETASKLGYSGKQLSDLAGIVAKVYEVAIAYDGELVEINPLMETLDGKFVAADFRMIIDDNSLFRHPELVEAKESELELTPSEAKARERGISYVELDGDIGVIGNGAGLVMATLDMIDYCKGKPANFCDIGGGASSDRMASALEILLSNEKVQVILINILGGITRCDEVARGILDVSSRIGVKKPMVVRMVGTMEAEGRKLLSEASIPYLDSMEEAAGQAVRLALEKS